MPSLLSNSEIDLSGSVTLIDGDANGDNKITDADVSIVSSHLTFFPKPANDPLISVGHDVDFDEDGSVDIFDYSQVVSNIIKVGDGNPYGWP